MIPIFVFGKFDIMADVKIYCIYRNIIITVIIYDLQHSDKY